MAILALDLARRTGWAIRLDSGELDSGTIDLGFHPTETIGSRLHRFREWLRPRLVGVDILAAERAHHRGGPATRQAVGMESVLELAGHEHDVELVFVHSSTIKKHATSNGRASKSDMIAAAVAAWPEQEVGDDNQADALWLLDFIERNGRK